MTIDMTSSSVSQGPHRNSLLARVVHERHERHERRRGSPLTREEWDEIRREKQLAKLQTQGNAAPQADCIGTVDETLAKRVPQPCGRHAAGPSSACSEKTTPAVITAGVSSSGIDQVTAPVPRVKQSSAKAAPEDVSPSDSLSECIVCFERVSKERSGRCANVSAGHVLCQDCCIGHTTEQTNPLTSMETLRAQGRPGGGVMCPASGCKCLWEAATLARLLPPDLFEQTCELRMRVREHEVFAKAQALLAGEMAKINEQLSQERSRLRVRASRQLLVEQLKRQIPDARQCGGCGFGPIDHGWCGDLRAHHGEVRRGGGRISNACPRCGWFRTSISEWPRWAGELPEEDSQQIPSMQPLQKQPIPGQWPIPQAPSMLQPGPPPRAQQLVGQWEAPQQPPRVQVPTPRDTLPSAMQRGVGSSSQARPLRAGTLPGPVGPLSEVALGQMSERQRIDYAIQLSLLQQGQQ